MDRHSKQAVIDRLAAVVRQFRPSRIERQLLAQVFEVVVRGPEIQSVERDSVTERPLIAQRRVAEGVVSQVARRRNAA